MTAPRRRARQPRSREPGPDRRPPDLWRPVAEPGIPAPISPVADPTALLRSLGPVPLPGQAGTDGYVAAVIERAAAVATALALASGMLASPD